MNETRNNPLREKVINLLWIVLLGGMFIELWLRPLFPHCVPGDSVLESMVRIFIGLMSGGAVYP